MNTREEFTAIDNIKPASTPEAGRTVVEGNKHTLGSTFGISGIKPSLFSIFGTKTKECKILNSRVIHVQKDYNGAIWWDFRVDEPYERQQGLDMQELGLLPSCTFEGTLAAPPPLAPDLFGVELMSCWSLIPPESNPLLWPAFGSSEVKPPTPYSNLCQIMLLDLPSQLSKDFYYKAVTEVQPLS